VRYQQSFVTTETLLGRFQHRADHRPGHPGARRLSPRLRRTRQPHRRFAVRSHSHSRQPATNAWPMAPLRATASNMVPPTRFGAIGSRGCDPSARTLRSGGRISSWKGDTGKLHVGAASPMWTFPRVSQVRWPRRARRLDRLVPPIPGPSQGNPPRAPYRRFTSWPEPARRTRAQGVTVHTRSVTAAGGRSTATQGPNARVQRSARSRHTTDPERGAPG
jgi:hypothetical protein